MEQSGHIVMEIFQDPSDLFRDQKNWIFDGLVVNELPEKMIIDKVVLKR